MIFYFFIFHLFLSDIIVILWCVLIRSDIIRLIRMLLRGEIRSRHEWIDDSSYSGMEHWAGWAR